MSCCLCAREHRPNADRSAIKIETVIKSGHGRLILRDGSDVAVSYLLNDFGSWCSGTLIGDMKAVSPDDFSHGLKVRLEDCSDLVPMIIGHSEIHVTFAARYNARTTGTSAIGTEEDAR